MESGRRWKDEDIPKTQWDLPHFLWMPAAELYGIERIEPLDDVLGGRRLVERYGHYVFVTPERLDKTTLRPRQDSVRCKAASR
jgi:hypothetical protein